MQPMLSFVKGVKNAVRMLTLCVVGTIGRMSVALFLSGIAINKKLSMITSGSGIS